MCNVAESSAGKPESVLGNLAARLEVYHNAVSTKHSVTRLLALLPLVG